MAAMACRGLQMPSSRLTRSDGMLALYTILEKDPWRLVALLLAILVLNGCERKVEPTSSSSGVNLSRLGVVVSGSMEPAVRGPGRLAECPNCPRRFRLSHSSIDESRPAYCPVCGHESTLIEEILQPDPIVYESLETTDSIQRESVIVFERDTKKEVKRVVGLPGETISIRDGDLWNGEVRIQKSLAEYLRQAILVRVERSQDSNCSWQTKRDGWAIYGHRSLWPRRNATMEMHPEFIGDESYFNQGESKVLASVRDIGLVTVWDNLLAVSSIEGRIHWSNGMLGIEAIRSGGMLNVRLLNRGSEPVSIDISNDKDGWIAFAIVDSALWFGTQSQQVCLCRDLTDALLTDSLVEPLQDAGFALTESMPLAIRSKPSLPVMRVVVRDIHRRGANDQFVQTLSAGPGRYTVLGDNDSVSDDSRTRLEQGVERERVVGWIPDTDDKLGSIKRQIHDIDCH
jgi:signal peptidase I